MARFAPVAPPRLVSKLSPAAMGNYHLLLAHDVVKHPTEYSALYRQFGFTTIMDNSVAELGTAVDLQLVSDAVNITQANVIVLPDVYLNCDETIEACTEAYHVWGGLFEKQLGSSGWGFMYVPQGKTEEEWIKAAEALAGFNFDRIKYWGIPRNYRQNIGQRSTPIRIARALNDSRKIHLLGFSDDMTDDVLSCRLLKGSEGIDSAVPLRAATLGIPMSFNMSAKIPPRGDWWETAEYVPQMDENVLTIKRWINFNG